MNIDLQEAGITLVIGAYTLYGVELIAWWANRQNLYTYLKDRKLISERGSVAISLALSFAIGMIMESTAAFLLRDSQSPIEYFSKVRLNQVTRRDTVRADRWALTPLGQEITASNLLSRTTGSRAHDSDLRYCAASLDDVMRDSLKDDLTRLYYQAKNTLMDDPERQAELLQIQRRMQFAGTFALCSALLAAGVALSLLTILIWPRRSVTRTRERAGPTRDGDMLAGAFVVLGVLCVLSAFAYRTEGGEYTRRVLGYYSSDRIERQLRDSTRVFAFENPGCFR